MKKEKAEIEFQKNISETLFKKINDLKLDEENSKIMEFKINPDITQYLGNKSSKRQSVSYGSLSNLPKDLKNNGTLPTPPSSRPPIPSPFKTSAQSYESSNEVRAQILAAKQNSSSSQVKIQAM